MISNQQSAAAIMAELLDGDMKTDPVEFWKELNWDVDTMYLIAQGGEAIGLGNADDLMVAMQMGAALALKGLEKKNESRPYEHLAVHETP